MIRNLNKTPYMITFTVIYTQVCIFYWKSLFSLPLFKKCSKLHEIWECEEKIFTLGKISVWWGKKYQEVGKMCKKLVHHKYFKILEGRGFLGLQPGARYPCSWLKLNCPALPWKELLKKHFRRFSPVVWPAIVIIYMSEERFLYRTGVIRG